MNSSPSVCVVVPIYRNPLPKHEQASLDRCMSILGSHPVVLVKPASLDVTDILRDHPRLRCENFSDSFFDGVAGYNRLLLSDEFYARFASFDFMLIHQLDVLVFDDRLLDWCRREYDFVGAPWLPSAHVPNRFERLRLAIRRRLYRWTDQQARHEPGMHFSQYKYAVGNGGFSLRRIAKMRDVLARLKVKADRYREGPVEIRHEDLFFCVEANRFWNRVKVPDYRIAARFAWELFPSAGAILTDGELPFGCHGWNKLHRDEWRPIFAKLGYDIDALLG